VPGTYTGLPCCGNIVIVYTQGMQSLKTWMDTHNVNQTQLAQELEVEQPTVWGWLNGKTFPRTKTLVRLSQYTGISIDELIRGTRRRESRKPN
jgi:transcriptional regulator with XRE-family HTH domain